MTRRSDDGPCLAGFGALFMLFVVVIVMIGILNVTHVEHRTCTVDSKDRVAGYKGQSDARVYTRECGTLRVADSMAEGTWSSADTYAKIKPGHRYTFKTRGYRIPVASMFPNIVKVFPA